MKTKDLFEKNSYDTGVSVDVLLTQNTVRAGVNISLRDIIDREEFSNAFYKMSRDDAYEFIDRLGELNASLEEEITELSIAFRNMIAAIIIEKLKPLDDAVAAKIAQPTAEES